MGDVIELRRCGVCGRNYPEFLEDDPDRCRCRRAIAAGVEKLALIDPDERLTLDALDLSTNAKLRYAHDQGLKIADGNHEHRRGLWLIGPPGLGKTHLMTGLFRKMLTERRRMVRWWGVSEFCREVQRSYGDERLPDRLALITMASNSEVVFLDDLGKERNSEDTASILFDLVDDLYVSRRSVIVSTNLTGAELRERYDDATLDRLRAMTELITIEGKSRRAQEVY
jgi:DNA replication protein DnaC